MLMLCKNHKRQYAYIEMGQRVYGEKYRKIKKQRDTEVGSAAGQLTMTDEACCARDSFRQSVFVVHCC